MEILEPILYEYYFKGSRQYVHGTTMFESFSNILRDLGITTFKVIDLRFHNELYNNGKIYIKTLPPEIESIKSNDLIATISILKEKEPIDIYLFVDYESKVIERKEDITHKYIKEVTKTNDYESTSKLINIKDFVTLITALVEVNKRTHITTIKDINNEYKYRWAFSKNYSVKANLEFPKELEVKIKHLGLKKNRNGKIYTLNRFNFSLEEKEYSTNMCFAYFKR